MVKQVVLLAGGKGTRMREMTETVPKPMVKIGGIPVLEHLMNIFNSFGSFEFIISSKISDDHAALSDKSLSDSRSLMNI